MKKDKSNNNTEHVDLKKSVLSVSPRDIHDRQIPESELEIRAVIDLSEETAASIMDVAERLAEMADAQKGKLSDELMELSTKLFESSSFQDLSGQRLNKVLRAMDSIAADLYIISIASGDTKLSRDDDDDIVYDKNGHAVNSAALLRGPQNKGKGISQADIDDLLSDFD